MGMAGISSLGVGSGVLTSDLVDQLVAVERRPADVRLTRGTQQSEALLSAYGKLRSAITELRLPMRQLSSADNLKAFSATSSNEDIGVSVDSAKASRGGYSLDVTSLATAQALASQEVFSDRDTAPVGEGNLTIAVGDKTASIAINSSNHSLQGLANAINDAGVGVSAGVIDTGNGFQLVLSADETGTANAVSITATESDGTNTDNTGLSRFAFNTDMEAGAGFSETIVAADAVMTINGVEVTRSSNNPDDVTALFAEQGRTTDGQVEFVRSGLNTQPGRYDINVTQAATRGQLTAGSALASSVDVTDTNDEFALTVNGATTANLKLTQGPGVTAQALVDDIQAQLNSNAALSASGESVRVALARTWPAPWTARLHRVTARFCFWVAIPVRRLACKCVFWAIRPVAAVLSILSRAWVKAPLTWSPALSVQRVDWNLAPAA